MAESKLRKMHRTVSGVLADLAPLFRHHRLSFIARNIRDDIDADVFISDDDPMPVADALLRLAGRDVRGELLEARAELAALRERVSRRIIDLDTIARVEGDTAAGREVLRIAGSLRALLTPEAP